VGQEYVDLVEDNVSFQGLVLLPIEVVDKERALRACFG
jgi:hypothetical protein